MELAAQSISAGGVLGGQAVMKRPELFGAADGNAVQHHVLNTKFTKEFNKTAACWSGLELIKGKNRPVRRMTAAIGHPTLWLVRVRIGRYELGALGPGAWRILTPDDRKLVLATT
jgi:16S rRNA U516 pseudouridylate synthase RsuA-like enzyme